MPHHNGEYPQIGLIGVVALLFSIATYVVVLVLGVLYLVHLL